MDESCKIVAVDLNGTLASGRSHNPEEWGNPTDGAREAMQEIRRRGYLIAVNTVVGDDEAVEEWLLKHEIPYDFVNESPMQPEDSSGKMRATAYIDDRSIIYRGNWQQTLIDLFSSGIMEKGLRIKAMESKVVRKARSNGRLREVVYPDKEVTNVSLFQSSKERRKALGDWGRSIVNKAPLNEGSGATGGYLVPTELRLGIDAALQEYSLFHKYAFNVPMQSNNCWIPSFDLAATHVTGASPLFGGMNLTWYAEGTTITESEPSFAAGQLVCKNLGGIVYISNQLVKDGGEAFGAYLELAFTKAIDSFVTRACLQGSVADQPAGVVSAPSTNVVTRQTTVTVTAQDITKMVGGLLPASFKNSIWVCSLGAFTPISALSQYIFNRESPEDGVPTGLGGALMTRPLFVSEHLPAVGTQGDLVLFDPTLYALGTREYTVEATDQDPTAFKKNQTAFRLKWRGDGVSMVRNTFKVEDGSTTVGVTVVLSTK